MKNGVVTDPLSLRTLVSAIGSFIAITTIIAIPCGYLWVENANLTRSLDFQAQVDAASIAKYVRTQRRAGQEAFAGLAEAIELTQFARGSVRERFVDWRGRLLLGEGTPPADPAVTRTIPVMVDDAPIGQIEIAASTRPMLLQTALVALASLLLGSAMFIAVRVFPLRVLDRTIGELNAASRSLRAANAELENRHRQAQQAHARLRAVVDATPAGLVFYDSDDRLVLWNRAYDEIYPETADLRVPGIRFEDILRGGIARGMYSDAHGREEEWLAERMRMHREAHRSLAQLLYNGRWVRVEDRRMPDGGFIGIRVDVTELKRGEEDLRVQNMRFDAALQNMSQGLAMFDRDGRLIVCNNRYGEIYGVSPQFLVPGTTLKQILEHRVANGVYACGSPDAYIRERLANAQRNEPTESILQLSNGRIITVAHRPMPDGAWVSTHEDVSDKHQAQAKLVHMARHDALTQLPNRVLFREHLEQSLTRVGRGDGFAVLCLDLDHFKDVNDTLGHPIGDLLLRAAGERLRGAIRATDLVARLGGDEFAIVQDAAEQPGEATALARRLVEAIGAPYELEGHRIVVGTSIGIALAPGDARTADQLLRDADMALYRAKAEGRGTYRFFEPEMDARIQARRLLELDLRNAITNGEFELFYQPLVSMESGLATGCEALVRWRHPERGLVPPLQFISIAEETGLIVPLGEWVLRQACREATAWPGDLKVAVNLSPVQFRNRNLVEVVFNALATSGLPPARLELEITESVLLQENESTLATLHQLRALGVRISMDDFGTGYSSLSYLRSFPFDKIKIDRSFTRDISDREDCLAIIRAVTGLGSSLGINTTAEGVETREQLEMLKLEGCTEIQGYYISPPVPARELNEILERLVPRAQAVA